MVVPLKPIIHFIRFSLWKKEGGKRHPHPRNNPWQEIIQEFLKFRSLRRWWKFQGFYSNLTWLKRSSTSRLGFQGFSVLDGMTIRSLGNPRSIHGANGANGDWPGGPNRIASTTRKCASTTSPKQFEPAACKELQRAFMVSASITGTAAAHMCWTCRTTSCRCCFQRSLTVLISTECTYNTMTCLNCIRRPFVASPWVRTASWTCRVTSCRICLQRSLTACVVWRSWTWRRTSSGALATDWSRISWLILMELNLGGQPPHNVTQRPLQRFHKSSKAAAAEQSAGETSAKAVSDSWQSSLGVFRTLEYVMQDDSLIFSVINHLSNKIIVLYVMQSFSLASPWPFGGCTKPSFTDGGRPHPTDTPSVIPRSREY